MLNDKIDAKWIDMFESIFQSCKLNKNETAVILSETQSRLSNVTLSELALGKMGISFYLNISNYKNDFIIFYQRRLRKSSLRLHLPLEYILVVHLILLLASILLK